MKKKLLAFLLAAIAIVACAFGLTACSGESGKTKSDNGLELTLSKNGKHYIVSGIGDYAETDLIIPSAHNSLPVSSIGDIAFYSCSGLTSITIPDRESIHDLHPTISY